MSRSYLKKLEDLFLEVSDLKSDTERQEFVDRVSRSDPDLGAELSNILLLQHESEELLQHPRDDYMSLLCTTLGEPKREETSDELLQFLKNLTPPENGRGLAALDNFHLTELVATGATGFLFKARDNSLKRDVAIKFLAPSIAACDDRREAFVSESRLASAIRNNHVVRIHHTFSDAKKTLAYYVMEWIQGTSLQNWLGQHQDRTSKQIDTFFGQICEGVAAIHECGIIHRDLTPGNIMIEADSNRLVIVDFGIALEGKTQHASGQPIGTPLYMSPEQFNGDPITKASDLFSLAEIACVLFCGSHPFGGQSLTELMENVFSNQPKISKSCKLNDAQINTLATALHLDPAKRQTSVHEFYNQFRNSNDNRQQGIPAITTISKRVWFASLLTALLLVVSVWALWPSFIQPAFEANPDSQTKNDVAPGIWLDANHFRNAAGMTFRHLETNPILEWPPSNQNPEWYRELGWASFGNRNLLIGKSLVTNGVFKNVMGFDPPALHGSNLNPAAPVTNISLDEADEFCRKLTEMDPDGLEYYVCSNNEWTYAVYGHAIVNGLVTPPQQTKWFQAKAAGTEINGAEYSAIDNALTGYWEWTDSIKLSVRNDNEQGQYGDLERVSTTWNYEIFGNTSNCLFLHSFDAMAGMSDYLIAFDNLEIHEEEDGSTVYLKPSVHGKTGSLIHRYVFQDGIESARLWNPIFVFDTRQSAGIQIRWSTSSDPDDLLEMEWIDLVIDAENTSPWNRRIEFTSQVQGARTMEVRYWLHSADKDTYKLQIGRTTPALKFERKPFRGFVAQYGIEVVTQRRSDSPRESVEAPRTFRSPHVSFRVCALPSSNVMGRRIFQ